MKEKEIDKLSLVEIDSLGQKCDHCINNKY